MSLPDDLSFPTPRDAGDPHAGAALQSVEIPAFGELGQSDSRAPMRDMRLLADVQVELAVELGRVRLPLRDLLSLDVGSVVELDRSAESPVDVLVNGTLVAHGEVVVIDGEFGVRITNIVDRG